VAEPAIPPAGSGKGPLANLSPRQRRYAVVAGVAGLLALVVLLGRRSSPAAAPAATDAVAADAAAYDPAASSAYIDPSSYAFPPDNSAYAASLGSAVADSLGEVTEAIRDTGLPNLSNRLSQQIGRTKALNKRLERQIDRLGDRRGGGGRGGRGRRGGGRKPAGNRPDPKNLPDKGR
jgi:hypothetical protein